MRSNCLFFALALYWRRRSSGHEGYIVIRRSRLAIKAPHVMYAEKRADGSLRVVGFVPQNGRRKKFPPPLFKGVSRWGDL